MKQPGLRAWSPGKMKYCLFWTIGAILLVLFIIHFLYIDYAELEIKKLMDKVINPKNHNISENDLDGKKDISPVLCKPKKKNGMWTVNAIGRLGNLMGEYATLYALAKMNDHQAYILPKMHSQLSKIFRIRLPVLHQDVINRITWKPLLLHNWLSDEYRSIEGDYVSFRGYPWSYTFYHHIRDEILEEFTFHDFIKKESNAYLAKLRGDRENVTFVGIHVRRGDYLRIMASTKKGVVADRAYLQKATEYFRNKYKNPLFVVTSNGMDWCKENINNSLGDVHFAGDGQEGSPERDFALLAHCNHTIMTIGTFGIWVGYFVGGETIYLSNYTLPDFPFFQTFKPEAVFPPEWIGIPANLTPLLNEQNTRVP